MARGLYTTEERKKLIEQLHQDILNAEKPLKLKKLLAEFSLKTGLRIETIHTYLKILEDSERIKVTDEEIIN